MGLSVLFTGLGVFQYIQVFLASTIYIEIYPEIFVSPGSSVLFVGSLFAVLLVYIKEDAIEARKVIYALVFANILLTLLQYLFSINLKFSDVINPLNIPVNLFSTNARVLFVGTITLLLDSILVIILYEYISRIIKYLYLRILIIMIIVISFDTILFSIGTFIEQQEFKSILFSGIIAKNLTVFIYSLILTVYIAFIDKVNSNKDVSFNDIFLKLTYRQKFESVSIEKAIIEKKSNERIKILSSAIDQSPSIVIIPI